MSLQLLNLTRSFSPKLIPWFVSDVTPPDFVSTISDLLSENFFLPQKGASSASATSEEHEYLRSMVTRWQRYLDTGVFRLSVPLDTPLGGTDSKVA